MCGAAMQQVMLSNWTTNSSAVVDWGNTQFFLYWQQPYCQATSGCKMGAVYTAYFCVERIAISCAEVSRHTWIPTCVMVSSEQGLKSFHEVHAQEGSGASRQQQAASAGLRICILHIGKDEV